MLVGVEEEFLLLDAAGLPFPIGPEVIAGAGSTESTLHEELARTQVEAATRPCHAMGELGEQLRGARSALSASAGRHGASLAATGVPLVESGPPPIGALDRYSEIRSVYAGLITDYQACGCHVHVEVPDRDLATLVLGHINPWLPALAALAANSPIRDATDSGLASLRLVQHSRFPGSGLAPWCVSAADYDRQVARLVDLGALIDDRTTFWLARLSPHLPTVEMRVADTALEPWEAVLQAALARALVHTAMQAVHRGVKPPKLDPQVSAAAVWAASRYGLDGPAVDPATATRHDARARLWDLLLHVTPALADLGDLALARTAITGLLARGTGAQVQRRALAAGGLPAALAVVAT